MATVFEAIKSRSSTRGYTDEKLTEEEVQKIVLAGLHAPTATNRQEIRFSVVHGDNPVLAELDEEKNKSFGNGRPGAVNFYYGAPTVFILSAEEGFKWSRLDAGIAVQNMALEAEELGLGSVIIGCIEGAMWGERREYFDKALKIPQGYKFEIALAVGHKATSKEPHTFDEKALVNYVD